MLRIILTSLLTWCLGILHGAEMPVDSLSRYSYEILLSKIEASEADRDLMDLYLRAYLTRAKEENNSEEIINGYKNYMYYSREAPCLAYADSMVEASVLTKNNKFIGSAYLTKGIVHYSRKEYKTALDHYLLADSYISKTDDTYLKYKTKYNIAQIKYYLGMYDEAIKLFDLCIVYFKDHDYRGYLNTLHSLSLCHNRLGNFGFSSELNKKGILEGERLSDKSMEPYFVHLEGVNYYHRKNYGLAIKSIKQSLTGIIAKNDFANETVGYFYIGKSYWELDDKDKAIAYLKKVEFALDEKKYIRPDLREGFEILVSYYQKQGDLEMKLHYIKKLIKADSLLNSNYKYLSEKIYKEYDTKELINKKKEIYNQLEYQKKVDKILIIGVGVLIALLLLLGYRYKKNKKLYKQRFEELIQNKPKEVDARFTRKRIEKIRELDMSPEVATTLLKQLEKFEKTQKFLESDWNLVKLAASFDSNTNYLSKIIYYYRGKKFVDYINDLKIDHIVTLLKTDKKIRNYTNKALAEEVGFSSTQRFTNAFVSRTGISPSYFIERLKGEE